MMGDLNPHENMTHMIEIPKNNNDHDQKFDNAEIINKKLSAPGGMAKEQVSDDWETKSMVPC